MNFNPLISFFLGLVLLISCDQDSVISADTKPDENRFTKSILTQGMDEPMAMDFLPNNKIIIVERKGGVKIFDENASTISTITTIPVNTKYTNKEGRTREAEEGLMGVIADPDFVKNKWIYMYYAHPDQPNHVLARWVLNGNELDSSSKVVVLEVETQREECCHTGGGMTFDKDGNLYLSVGNNTVNPPSGASNLDERLGYENADDQRGPSNSNDLRGKILRIHPEKDGSYTIPDGNLFPDGTVKTRPEIYTMGHRNPWRVSLDSQTGYLYWGEVGPDANVDSIWGPKGYDEFNQAKGPGFFGWPYFVGNNRPYNSHDVAKETYGAPFDVNNVVNNSVNNTGIQKLPTPIPAFISYPYGPSEDFPLVGSSGRSATGGPIFRKADFQNGERPFPAYYEGKWLIVDFMRDWIMAVSMDENGDYESMERFLPNQNFSAAIDMDFGLSGDLYVLEYGDAWFRKNSNSQLVKIEFNSGNRKPNIVAKSDVNSGSIPLQLNLTSEGTNDYDKYDEGKLKYVWTIISDNGFKKTIKEENPSLTLDKAGIYNIQLEVTDSKKSKNRQSFEVISGNQAPEITIDLLVANESFFFGLENLAYNVSISDKEDGNSIDGQIKNEEASVTFDFIPQGFDPINAAANQSGADLLAIDAVGRNLIEKSDCKSCHQYNSTSIGPSYESVAKKYDNTIENKAILKDHIINGSSGIWGEHAMAAHPELTDDHARRMVEYIMTFMDIKPTVAKLPFNGRITPYIPDGENREGKFMLRASYQDKGVKDLKSLTSEAYIVLRNPIVNPEEFDIRHNVQNLTTPQKNFHMLGKQSYIGLSNLDLTNIAKIEVVVIAGPWFGSHGGKIEVRLDQPDGQLVGTSDEVQVIAPPPRAWQMKRKENETEAEKKKRRRLGHQEMGISLESTNSKHDIYLVFTNPDAKENEILMSIKEVEFYKNQKSKNEL